VKVKVLFVMVLVNLLLVSGLWAQGTSGKTLLETAACPLPPSVQVGENDNGNLVKVFQGQDLVLSLTSNPSTGYDWHLQDISPSILEQTEVNYKSGSSANLVPVGSGGTKVYTFRAKKAGESNLTLAYQRSWETASPTKTFSVRVFVGLPPTPPSEGNFAVKAGTPNKKTYKGVVYVKIWKEIENGEEEPPEITAGPQTITEYTKNTYDRFGSAVFAAHDMAPNVEARAIEKANAMWAGVKGSLRTETKWDFVEVSPDRDSTSATAVEGNSDSKSVTHFEHVYKGAVYVKVWKEIENGEEEPAEITAGPQTITEYTTNTYDRFGSAVLAAHDMAPNVEARAIEKANAMWSGIKGTLKHETTSGYVEVHQDH